MDLFSIFFIAVGLAMDTFAVSVANGALARTFHFRRVILMPLFFGGFQAIMPIVGWLAGIGFQSYISGFDHWLAFLLLLFIGAKMIYESLFLEKEAGENAACSLNMLTLLALSVATSLDALAVGLSFSFLGVKIFLPALIIGIITFFISLAGIFIGKKIGHLFEGKIEILGGLVLIAIGLKILFSHLL